MPTNRRSSGATRRAKFQEEIRQLTRAKDDMSVEQTFLADKFKQLRHENDRLKADVDAYKSRLGNATEDYVGPHATGGQRHARRLGVVGQHAGTGWCTHAGV
jgi:hypothetical protein